MSRSATWDTVVVMQFVDHFSGVAADYAAHRPGYPAELFRWLASVTPQSRLAWDCACGSGQAARSLADTFARVVATDASSTQIFSASGPGSVVFAVAPATSAPIADHAADLVTVAQALHWFANNEFFDEVRRVVTPGGVFAAWTYGLPRISNPAVEDSMLRFYSETVGPFWPPERRLVMEGYASVELPMEELHTPEFPMDARWTLPQLLGFLRSWSATARYVNVHGTDPLIPLADRLETLWGNAHSIEVSWPLTVRAGRL